MDLNRAGKPKPKALWKLPVKDPGGMLNNCDLISPARMLSIDSAFSILFLGSLGATRAGGGGAGGTGAGGSAERRRPWPDAAWCGCPSFAQLPTSAVEHLVAVLRVGILREGSPLRELLDELGPHAPASVRRARITGVATGQHPRTIARQIRRELGGNLIRALMIARTEVLRWCREASLQSYRANDDIVKGWIWHSGLRTRTCAACWAMRGTVHKLDDRLEEHVRGRGTMIPISGSWAELGFAGIPDTRVQVEPGTGLFCRLPESQQIASLGPPAFSAHKAGAVTLEDFVGRRHDRRWGSMRYARRLRDVLGPERASAYTRLAMLGAVPGGKIGEPDRLILEAATGARRLSPQELQQVLEHVARAGFDPRPDKRGKTAAEKHHRKHVESLKEWPEETTLEQYLGSIRGVVLDAESSILTSRYQGTWQLAAIRHSNELRGPGGFDWVVIEYRVGLGYWVTAFQPEDLERGFLRITGREHLRWLRRRS